LLKKPKYSDGNLTDIKRLTLTCKSKAQELFNAAKEVTKAATGTSLFIWRPLPLRKWESLP